MSESPENPTPPPPSAALSPRNWLADLHLAFAFLSRIPVADVSAPPGALASAMRCFPLVGVVLGLLAGGIGAAGIALSLPPLASALLAILFLVVLTGALHEDGLADLADGFGARGDVAARLAAMRDSRIGTYGVLALIFSVSIRVVTLAAAPNGWRLAGAALAAGALSRAMIPVAMQFMAPARSDGLGANAGIPHAGIAALAAAIGLLAALIGLGLDLDSTGAAAAAALLAGLAVAGVARHALGGYTGDVLGAVQQAAEVAVLLAIAGSWGP